MTPIIGDIRQTTIDKLKATGHTVEVYPQRRLVVVDGLRRYRLKGKYVASN